MVSRASRLRRRLRTGAARAAAAAGLVSRRRETGGLLVLMFHKVNERPDPLLLTVSPALFKMVVAEVGRRHEVVGVEAADGGKGDPCRSSTLKVAITFDDGYRDTYTHAFPVLREHGLPATIYLSTDHVDGRRRFWYEQVAHALLQGDADRLDLDEVELGVFPLGTKRERTAALLTLNEALKRVDETRCARAVETIVTTCGTDQAGTSPMLTWNMAREMQTAGIRFGSHTTTHPILTQEMPERVWWELVDSRRRIEAELGRPVHSFAYPNGTARDFDDKVIAQVRKAGYRNACTTIEGVNRKGTDPFALRRVNVHAGMCTDASGSFDADLFWAKALQVL